MRIVATNKQLPASEPWIVATNKQLRASGPWIVATNGCETIAEKVTNGAS